MNTVVSLPVVKLERMSDKVSGHFDKVFVANIQELIADAVFEQEPIAIEVFRWKTVVKVWLKKEDAICGVWQSKELYWGEMLLTVSLSDHFGVPEIYLNPNHNSFHEPVLVYQRMFAVGDKI